MVVHFSLALNLGEKKHVWKLAKRKSASVTRIIQVTYDKPGLFSKMAGVLALNNMDILSASIFTLKNGLAFDTYEVTNPPDAFHETENWAKTQQDLQNALDERLSLDRLIQEKRDAKLPAAYGPQVRKKSLSTTKTRIFSPSLKFGRAPGWDSFMTWRA